MTLAQSLLLLATLTAWVFMAWKGRAPEWLAALVLVVLTFGAPLVAAEGWWAAWALSGSGFLALTVLALWRPRWWLIGAAGVQLVAVLTHVAWAGLEIERLWPAVTLRLFLWTLIILLALAGVAEARWAPYARNEGRRAHRPS